MRSVAKKVGPLLAALPLQDMAKACMQAGVGTEDLLSLGHSCVAGRRLAAYTRKAQGFGPSAAPPPPWRPPLSLPPPLSGTRGPLVCRPPLARAPPLRGRPPLPGPLSGPDLARGEGHVAPPPQSPARAVAAPSLGAGRPRARWWRALAVGAPALGTSPSAIGASPPRAGTKRRAAHRPSPQRPPLLSGGGRGARGRGATGRGGSGRGAMA